MWRSPRSLGRRHFPRHWHRARRRLRPKSGLLEPVLSEILGAVRDAAHGGNIERRLAGNHQQRLQDSGVAAAAGEERLADPPQDMGAVAQKSARLPWIAAAEI